MELIYQIFSVILLFHVLLFILLNILDSTNKQSKIINILSKSQKVKILLSLHFLFIIIAIILYFDNSRIQHKYRYEKDHLNQIKQFGTQLRKAQLSYKIILIQRNMYIVIMTIFTSIAVDIYILLTRYYYQKKDNLQLRKKIKNTNVSARQSLEKKNQ